MTHPSDSRGLSHLFIEALAEFALQRLAEVYLGNAKSDVASSTMRFAERSELPISGIFRELLLVFNWRQVYGVTITWGMEASTLMSSTKSPKASDKRIPVSASNEMMRRCSSSRIKHSCWIDINSDSGIGFLTFASFKSGKKIPENGLLKSNPNSVLLRLIIDRRVERFLLTVATVNPLKSIWSLNFVASDVE